MVAATEGRLVVPGDREWRMSEEFKRCVRGCTRRCNADHCLTVGQHDHEPLPREATVGLLCEVCSDRLRGALTDIGSMYPDLDLYASQRGFAQDGGSHGKLSGSPALIRIDVAAMLDPESCIGDGTRSIIGTLESWAQCIHDDLGITLPEPYLEPLLSLLTTWHSKICEQPWIDDYWLEMLELQAMLRRATDAPRPIGHCFGRIVNKPCGRPLYEPVPPEIDIVCPEPSCARRYTGTELIMLRLQAEREGVA